MSTEKLGKFLQEVSNWTWDEFVRAEHDKNYTTNQSIIFGLVRSCASQKLPSIKIALNRLDGKLKTPVRIEYPKMYFLYPNASGVERDIIEDKDNPKLLESVDKVVVDEELPVNSIVDTEPVEPRQSELPSLSLRETLTKMSDFPRAIPEAIIQLALQTHQWVENKAPKPDEIPRVKSVVAANLLVMAQNRNIDAITEVFDQIDGKLVETIQILGEDIYISSYSSVAPEGAKLNADGIYQIEATQTQNHWMQKLSELNKKK